MVAATTVPRLPRQKMTGEVLEDKKKNGKNRDWKRKKIESLRIAEAYRFIEEWSRSEKLAECGAWLTFAECPIGHQRKLVNANFCRQRLCSMCSWRRALLTASQVRLVAHTALQQDPRLRFLLVTLTVPNVPGEQLGASLTDLIQSFKRLLRVPEIDRILLGYFLAAEVKYSKKRGNYHPHLHVLIAVPERYFADWYIKQPRWLQHWQKAARNPDITQVDVRMVKPKRKGADGLSGAAAEVGKYVVTSKEVIQKDLCATAKVVAHLHKGLYRRRLTQYGRLLKTIQKQLKLQDAEEASSNDLISIRKDSKCACEVCQSPLVELLLTTPRGLFRKFDDAHGSRCSSWVAKGSTRR